MHGGEDDQKRELEPQTMDDLGQAADGEISPLSHAAKIFNATKQMLNVRDEARQMKSESATETLMH
jgi:hypothetical protein